MEQNGKVGCNYNSSSSSSSSSSLEEDQMELRRGPWTVEEDFTLINYIAHHGEGRWNSLARCAGLKRTGKSCRLRWLNYLRPDVRRGNITLEEQLLILELHSRWGNRWSKIAQHLPGRTDNEIKNYWRTRVQKHAKQLKCDVNSKQFKDTMRYLWMPRLLERIQAQPTAPADNNNNNNTNYAALLPHTNNNYHHFSNNSTSTAAASSDSFVSDMTADHCYNNYPPTLNQQPPPPPPPQDYYPTININNNNDQFLLYAGSSSSLTSPTGYFDLAQLDFIDHPNNLMDGGDVSDNLWNVDDDDMWFLPHQFNTNIH